MLERQTADIPQSTRELCSPSYPLSQGSSSQIKAHALGPFCLGRCERSVRGAGSAVASWLHPKWSPLSPPNGFPLQEQCLCSKMYLFSYSFWELCKTKKGRTAIRTILSPSALQPHPTATSLPSLSVTVSTSLDHSSCAYFAEDANDLSPLYSDARSVYTFPFHPHTNVLLLPLRPRAF